MLAALGLPVIVVAAWLGGWWLVGLVGLIALGALGEYYAGAHRQGARPAVALGYAATLGLLIATQFGGDNRDHLVILILALATMLGLMLSFARRRYQGAMMDVATTLFGIIYLGLGMSFYLRLCHLDLPQLMGVEQVLFTGAVSTLLLILLPVWVLDTVAFTVGKAWGRLQLAPRLSPQKTWEGALGGFLAAVLTTVLLGVFWNHLPWEHSLVLGCLIGVFAQLGDLAESLLKRDLGLKDFGTLFGPHGGVMDRFDGVLFAMPVAYLYLWLLFVA